MNNAWASSPTAPKKLARNEQIKKALDLRISGKEFREIAAELDVALSTAHGLVREALDEQRKENLERSQELISIENSRLDKMQAALAPAVSQGKTRAIETSLKIMARRARLNGLDAAQKVAVTGASGVVVMPPRDDGNDEPIEG